MTQRIDASGEYREKRASSVADFGLDWATFLAGDTIASPDESSTWEVPDGITQAEPDPSKTSTTTTIWLSGGTEGQEYVLKNTIITAGGRTWVKPLRIKVVAVVQEAPAYDYTELAALRRAYATGALRVRYGVGSDQKEVEYPNGDELLKRIRHLEGVLDPEPATAVRRRQVRMSTGKGF